MKTRYHGFSGGITHTILLVLVTGAVQAAEPEPALEEILVIGNTPGAGLGIEVNKVPFAVQSATAGNLARAQSLDLTDFLNHNMSAVNINSAQNNPLQPDVQFRGFTASPLLGLPQGISVYQNGVRINEPLGDSVNWDLLPETAVASIELISGADPLFGLNTLGGALSVKMKNGFNFDSHQAEVYTGSWGRLVSTLESGGIFSESSSGEWGYYVNASHFEEDGWRQFSDSDALNFYSSLSWRNDAVSTLNLNLQKGDSNLRGNGAAPVGLIALQRDAIFTAPDITENDMTMFSVDGSHFITPDIQISATGFWRENRTDAFNGDGSEFSLCNYSGGGTSFFDDAEELEDDLDDLLGVDLDNICDGADPSITSLADLETLIANQAFMAGLDPEEFELEEISDDLSGTGVLSDEGINNISNSKEKSQGFDGNILFLDDLFGHSNRLIVGTSYYKGSSNFNSVLELSYLDPITRTTEGLGTGTFYDAATTQVKTETETWGILFSDSFNLTPELVLTLSGRYNNSDVTLKDQSGDRPELDGDHNFARFNPSLGFTFDVNDSTNVYASYSESNRVPTPIELACNEGIFELAQQNAVANGGDPDDVDFECRLPNAFLADPPLEDVVTKSFELGARGEYAGLSYQMGVFHAVNHDDILFQSTGRSTGLFANVDKTQRTGFESSLNGSYKQLDWYASYSYIQATFEDNFIVLSPNNPLANDDGNIFVQGGDRIPGIPESLVKLGGDYYFSDRLSLGLEAIYNSSQVLRGDESNQLDEVDGYTIVNLRTSYQFNDWFTVFARVSNVFDKEYENFGLLGEDPSEILDNISDTRPFYLGVGGPRAAWVGIRVKF
jgi:iron complex outermembrane recepter protein